MDESLSSRPSQILRQLTLDEEIEILKFLLRLTNEGSYADYSASVRKGSVIGYLPRKWIVVAFLSVCINLYILLGLVVILVRAI